MKWATYNRATNEKWTVIMTILVSVLSWSSPGYTQLSEYNDCSETGFDKSEFERPLTQEEQIALWDDEFHEQLADITRCTDGQSGSSNGGGGSKSSQKSRSTNSTFWSDNYLEVGEKSTSVANTVSQVPQSGNIGASDMPDTQYSNGRKEQALTIVDNKAALRAQIKAQIELETDPGVKRQLTKEYEALK
ncbi:MAG: hypothetical protein CMK29_06485 [Porticoccaceae bacterium]|nr:hypothetical protein [Porticoccaceae bacterium]